MIITVYVQIISFWIILILCCRLLAGYNSLTDPHLVGYFANNRLQRQLRKAGLVCSEAVFHHLQIETVVFLDKTIILVPIMHMWKLITTIPNCYIM